MKSASLTSGVRSSLGTEWIRKLTLYGEHLVLVARETARLEHLAAELTGADASEVEVLSASLSSPTGITAVIERLTDEARPIQTLSDSAGFGLPPAFERNYIEDEARHPRLHVEVPLRLMHTALPGLLARRSGTILSIASAPAAMPCSTYRAAKSCQVTFSRWASSQYRSRGVTVTAVCPGCTHADFHARLGLPEGKEGTSGWPWLETLREVSESLRDVEKGEAVSMSSKRYKAIYTAARLAPTGPMAKLTARGHCADCAQHARPPRRLS
ncbi:SDR family NAD(P)-dependent oxidoreductase [Brachybacterium sp. AOP42-C2-15]